MPVQSTAVLFKSMLINTAVSVDQTVSGVNKELIIKQNYISIELGTSITASKRGNFISLITSIFDHISISFGEV